MDTLVPLTFGRTRDYALIRQVLTHPSQTRMAAEDATDIAAWEPHRDERVYYLAVQAPTACVAFSELVGIVTAIPQNAVCYEIHVAFLPHAWGMTRPALRGAIAWLFAHTDARRIVAAVPAYNRLAIALGKDAGMTEYGRNPASFMRGGALHDQLLLGISK